MNGNADEARIAIEALRQADRDLVAFELDEGDGEETFLGDGFTYERIKARVDAAVTVIESSGLTRETAAEGTLALLESVLLTTYASHMDMIEAAVRMTEAAKLGADDGQIEMFGPRLHTPRSRGTILAWKHAARSIA